MQLDQIIGEGPLWLAWGKVLANRGGPGGDGVTLEVFAEGARARLARLRRDILDGIYRPGPLRRLDVPKRSGGTRPLAIPCVADRVAQTAVAEWLSRLLEPEFEDASFGYRPGRSVGRAVARVSALRDAGYEWVVDGDIERFFETVPHGRLLDKLTRHVTDPAIVDLIARWLVAYGDGGRGLAQGSPLSPVLSNLYLDAVDEGVECQGVRLVRFADDFLVLCRNQDAAEDALERIAALLGAHGLRLNPQKTRIVPFQRGVRFLGKLFVRSLVVDAPEDEAPSVGTAVSAHVPSQPQPRGLAPVIRTLYVLEPGRHLDVRNESFTVREGEDGPELAALPPREVGRIEIGPHGTASARALRQALDWGVGFSFVDGHGTERGRLEPAPGDNGGRHAAQAAAGGDGVARLDLARRFVDGRIQTELALLRRLNRRRKLAAVDDAAERVKRIRRKLPSAASLEQLMGVEGEAAAAYWPALGQSLEHGWSFRTRQRRNGADPVNLLLDWAASLLARDMRVLLLRHGLHPGLSFLHSPRDGHDALVSDMIEEFRAPVAEALVAYVLNNRILGRDDFTPTENGEGRGVRVGGRGGRAFIRAWEDWLARPVRNPRTGLQRTWRGLMEDQVLLLVRHLDGTDSYAAYHMDY